MKPPELIRYLERVDPTLDIYTLGFGEPVPVKDVQLRERVYHEYLPDAGGNLMLVVGGRTETKLVLVFERDNKIAEADLRSTQMLCRFEMKAWEAK